MFRERADTRLIVQSQTHWKFSENNCDDNDAFKSDRSSLTQSAQLEKTVYEKIHEQNGAEEEQEGRP